jgi:ubiquitin C-terminal hydrolase
VDINYLLRRFFEEDKLDSPEDFISCPNCSAKKPKGCQAIKEFFVKDPPTVLLIQLKRFKSSGFSYSKNSSLVKNLEEIYLDNYVLLGGNI